MEKLQRLRLLLKRKPTNKPKHKASLTQSDAKTGGSKTTGQFFISKVKIPMPGKVLILKTGKILSNIHLLRPGIEYTFDANSNAILSPLAKYIHSKYKTLSDKSFKELNTVLNDKNLTPGLQDVLDLLSPFGFESAFILLRRYLDFDGSGVCRAGESALVKFSSTLKTSDFEKKCDCTALFLGSRIGGISIRLAGIGYVFKTIGTHIKLITTDAHLNDKKIKLLQAICKKIGYTVDNRCIKNDNKNLDILL